MVSSLLKKQAATSKGERLTSMVQRMPRSTGLVAVILLLQAMSWAAGKGRCQTPGMETFRGGGRGGTPLFR